MPKIRKRWTEENMEEAIRRVREGETAYQVAKDMDIPISTLSAKSTGKLAMNAKLGGKTILTTEEENLIVQWMLNLSSKGFPVTKSNVIANVSALMQKSNRPNPFVNGVPGRKWFSGFLHRHQDISERITHSLGKRRAEITEGDIRGWFASVQTELDKNNLTNIDGERKFNCDETSFSLSASSEPADDKENLAVLFMTNAQGKLAPPLIMFPNKRISYGIKKSVPEGWAVGKSENGWMTGDAFFYYITKVFNPWLIKENIEKPVVLFLDGHKSHTTAPLLEFCATNGIEIVVLFSNATHILQPEEVSLFRNLKRAWSKKVAEWQEKNGKYIRKEDFAPLLQEAISKLDWEKTMKNGFQKTGLHPFNPDAIDYRHLLTANGHPNYEERQAPGTSLLDGLENVIDPDVLEGFRSFEQEGSYQGDLENVGLYDVWRRIKELVASTDAEQENAASFTSDAQVIEMSEALLKNPIFPSGSSFKSNEQTKPLTSRVTKKGCLSKEQDKVPSTADIESMDIIILEDECERNSPHKDSAADNSASNTTGPVIPLVKDLEIKSEDTDAPKGFPAEFLEVLIEPQTKKAMKRNSASKDLHVPTSKVRRQMQKATRKESQKKKEEEKANKPQKYKKKKGICTEDSSSEEE